MRSRNRHANTGKAARPNADEYLHRSAAVEHLRNHRHQALGMAAPDHLIAARYAFAPFKQGGGTSCARRVECQDHRVDSGHMRPNAATPQTASTDSTSGT